jgi:mannose-6-phosphate isomerase
MTPILAFEEGYVPRMWGGTRMREVYHKPTPADQPIGEAWLVADHAQHESVVKDGPLAGRTLRQLLQEDAAAILGSRARLTVHGRFPLLLKLLDAGEELSIQVHPDDAAAARLREPDVGKTEMWYVIEGRAESLLYCGLPPEVDAAQFESARSRGRLADLMTRIPAQPDTAVFVPAGTVHAIGAGCLLAEIQQNSDLTYRIDDWGRTQPDGTPRELHIEKALNVTRFGSRHAGAAHPLAYDVPGARINVLAACRYFAAEHIAVSGGTHFDMHGESFQLCLGLDGRLTVIADGAERALAPGEALLVAGRCAAMEVRGQGAFLRYYVPDLARDTVRPLRAAGHSVEAIVALGGDASTSDIALHAGADTRA